MADIRRNKVEMGDPPVSEEELKQHRVGEYRTGKVTGIPPIPVWRQKELARADDLRIWAQELSEQIVEMSQEEIDWWHERLLPLFNDDEPGRN